MYMDGVGSSQCTPDAAQRPSVAQASPRSPPPTQLSPPLFTNSTHDNGCIFVPTPGRPTPPVVQAKPTQDLSLPNPNKSAAQVEQIRSENIVPVHGLRRSLRTNIDPLGCGTSDGKHHDLWKYLWNPQTKHNYKRFLLWFIPMCTSANFCPSLLSLEW